MVPETKPLSQMLEEFRTGRSHMAMVVDEFGTIVGHADRGRRAGADRGPNRRRARREGASAAAAEADEVELDGATRIRDLESEYGIEIPADAGFETLAGFLLFRLGEIPHAGEAVEYQGRRYTVLEMERNRIARVRIEKLPAGWTGLLACPSAIRVRIRSDMLGIDAAARYTWTAAVVLLLLCLVYLVRSTLFIFISGAAVRLSAFAAGEPARPRSARKRTRTPALALAYLIFVGVVVLVAVEIGSRVVEQARRSPSISPT